MTLLLIDRSHFNAEPDFAAFKAAAGAGVICKATEGVGWADPTFAACRAGTHAAGLVFGSYHFAHWTDPVAEADYYLSVAAPAPGELVALDAEAAPPPGVDVVAWSLAFCQAVHAAVGAWPLIYMNQSWAAGHNWAPVATTDGLWLARYDGIPTGGPAGAWQALAMKQYTDAASIPGEAGLVDADAFQGDLPTLLKYAVPGVPSDPTGAPMSATGPASWDQADLDTVGRAVWGWNVASKGVQAQDRLYGMDGVQLPAIKAEMDALAAKVDGLAGPAPAAPQVSLDAASVAQLAAGLAGDAGFVTALAVALDAQVARRFQTPAP